MTAYEGNNGVDKGNSPKKRKDNLHTDESRDSYLNQKPATEPAQCPVCGNIYANKRWYRSDQYDLSEDESGLSFMCPGCRKVKDNYYYGELRIGGSFLKNHRQEISGLIQNEVHRRQEKNPLSKLVEVEVERNEETARGEVIFHTTNAKLAELLGRALENAFGGELEVQKSEPITRVNWWRDKKIE